MEEISTSFCFICLLHLANERGLKLEAGSEGKDEDEDQKVGVIWDLKVCIVSSLLLSIFMPDLITLRYIEIPMRLLQHNTICIPGEI